MSAIEKKKKKRRMPASERKKKKKQMPATEKKTTPDVLNLNNEVVRMRKEVKRVRVLIIRRLTRIITILKKKKGTEDDLERNRRRAARLLEEIHEMKALKPDQVTKAALLKTLSFEVVCKDPSSKLSDRATARIASHPQFSKKIDAINAAIRAFKEERMNKSGQKKGEGENKPEEVTAQSEERDGEGGTQEEARMEELEDEEEEEEEKKQEEEEVEMEDDAEDGVLKESENATVDVAAEEERSPADATALIQGEEASPGTDARHEATQASPDASVTPCAATAQDRDMQDLTENTKAGMKVTVRVEKETVASEKKQNRELGTKEPECKEGEESSSDEEEEKEYFDDSTEERFQKQSSLSEESGDDDFFVGKVKRFKKKKSSSAPEREKKRELETDSVDPLTSKAAKLESVFCSSLSTGSGSRGGGGQSRGGGGRGVGHGRGRGFQNRGGQRGGGPDRFSKDGPRFQKQGRGTERKSALPRFNSEAEHHHGGNDNNAGPKSRDRGSATGRGRGRGRGDVARPHDRRGPGASSHHAPQQALHPSWEASKKRKEQQGQIQAFQGKKITFDD